jgi:hypothetical protein
MADYRSINARFRVMSALAMWLLVAPAWAQVQTEERWYEIEVTVFAHDNAMQSREIWPMELLQQPVARSTRPLDTLMSVYDLPDWSVLDASLPRAMVAEDIAQASVVSAATQSIDERVSGAPVLRSTTFRLPDPQRDALLALPSSARQFQDTNRALSEAGRYRVMYHNAWRQPMQGSNQAIPIWIEGGNRFGQRHELEGSLNLRFNPGQDRVVLDVRLWLTQFSAMPPADRVEFTLPALPVAVINQRSAENLPDEQQWHNAQVIPVLNTRELRSNEFHYLDHPAVGVIVQIQPYEVPPLPEPELATEPVVDSDSATDASLLQPLMPGVVSPAP